MIQIRPRSWRIFLLRTILPIVVIGLIATLWVRSWTRAPGESFSGTPQPIAGAEQELEPAPETEPLPRLRDRATTIERLRTTVQVLADSIGPRHNHKSESLLAAEEWIVAEWEDQGYTVVRQPVESRHGLSHNLEVILPGTDPTLPALLFGAHYDSEAASWTPGADDNASGVAVLLELSRGWVDDPPPRTLRFIAWTNEEPPYFQTPQMGSLVHAMSLQQAGVELLGAISLETLGYYDSTPGSQKFPPGLSAFYPDRGDFVAFVGFFSGKALIERSIASFRKVAEIPSESFAGPSAIQGVGWSDHWSYATHGYSAFMITDTAPYRNPNYHERTDTPDTLDYEAMTRIAEGLRVTVAELAGE